MIPIEGIKVYNLVPSDYYKCHVGTIVETTPVDFVVQYKDNTKVRYEIDQIRYFTLDD